MVVRREKKRRRGERTYHGRHVKWRGGGSRGGRGNVSLHKHKMKWAERKKGFRYPLRREKRTINLDELNDLIEKMVEERRLDKSNLRLNLKEFGYDKLLGRGRIEYPVFVEVEEASKKAIDKIKNKGGDVKVQQF